MYYAMLNCSETNAEVSDGNCEEILKVNLVVLDV